MPPHSEVESYPFVEVEDRLRKRPRRSRSISPRYFRKMSGQCKFNNNTKYHVSRNNYGITANRSRSISVSSEVHALMTDANISILAIRNWVIQPTARPVVVCFHEAPAFLKFNPFIYRGYRINLDRAMCIKSLFWWTNETLNAWTHLLGWIYFAYFTLEEAVQLIKHSETSTWEDNFVNLWIAFSFQICMAMSVGYHTFSCHSKDTCRCWLSYDLCGVSFSMLAVHTTEIYYFFWCQHTIRTIYITISGTLFLITLILQTTPKFLKDRYCNTRLIILFSFSGFGILPCLHWVWQNVEFTTHVLDLVSQISIMYLICGFGLFVYITKIPEVWFPGSVDFVGSSHQWWHIIVFLAFRHWQMTCKYFASLRSYHGCFEKFSGFSSSAVNLTADIT